MKPKFNRTKYACYYTYLAMSSIYVFPSLMFVTFRAMYDISYTLLGTLVLINFCTQLTVDFIFTFLTKFFPPHQTLKTMPFITTTGLLIFALGPTFFPDHAYICLVIGTVIFSIAAGLCEVLLSPTVAAIPSDHPERDMSTLHSLYAYGVVSVVVISTLFFAIFGRENWMYLTLFWAVLPLGSAVLFAISPLPEMDMIQSFTNGQSKNRRIGLLLCMGCIFLGAATEGAMTNWISGYVENALQIPKTVGDILGIALFAILLGFTRTWYAKYGKNIHRFMLFSMAASIGCYIVAALSGNAIVSLIACVVTGICTSMLWPGTLILMEERIPNPGVVAYALMAAGGDTGAALAPQMMGFVVDSVSASDWAASLGTALSLSPEQVGLKTGMLLSAIFPILGVLLLLYIGRWFKKKRNV